jgi:lipoprotein-anchoring transpeptidase ErfK/SrfK
MSKKLIAVAAAAALALTGLVGIAPATAAMVTSGTTLQDGEDSLLVTSTVSRDGAGTSADPYTIDVPSSGLATSGTTLRFEISTTAQRVITVTATSGIRLLAEVEDDTAVVLTGADSLTVTADSDERAEFYAYPTSTTKGVVTITNDGDITQIYVEGNVGPAYDIGAVTLPALEPEEEGVIVAVVTDAFGNVVDKEDAAASLTVTRVGTGSPSSTDVQYSDTTERWEGTITAGATAGQLAVSLVIAGLTATDEQEEAFGAPNNTFFGIINVSAAKSVAAWEADIKVLNDRITVLTTQLEASRPKATSVPKKKYNKLARKWNAANPGAKVALKK